VGLLLLALLPRVGGKRRAAAHDRDRAVVERGHEHRHVDPVEREAYERGRRDAEREHTVGHDRTARFDKEPVHETDRDRTAADDARTERADPRDGGGFRRL
jgi:hypothetical protein